MLAYIFLEQKTIFEAEAARIAHNLPCIAIVNSILDVSAISNKQLMIQAKSLDSLSSPPKKKAHKGKESCKVDDIVLH